MGAGILTDSKFTLSKCAKDIDEKRNICYSKNM